MYNPWEENAKVIEEECGGFVNWEEGFYICPECGEPIYDSEWAPDEFCLYICPICEWNGD